MLDHFLAVTVRRLGPVRRGTIVLPKCKYEMHLRIDTYVEQTLHPGFGGLIYRFNSLCRLQL
jgi:hypothetical protein